MAGRPRHQRASQRITTTVMGQTQIDTWRAMCFIAGRQSHQLANDLILEAIRYAQDDAALRRLVRDAQRRDRNIRIVR